jgi:hypothetical protein
VIAKQTTDQQNKQLIIATQTTDHIKTNNRSKQDKQLIIANQTTDHSKPNN